MTRHQTELISNQTSTQANTFMANTFATVETSLATDHAPNYVTAGSIAA